MRFNLYRVILPCDDLDKACAFYSAVFEDPGTRASEGRHYFYPGDTILALVQPTLDHQGYEFRANVDHVYFAVDDLEEAHERVRAAGPAMLESAIKMRPCGERSFYARDPAGNPICFVDEATLFTGRA